MATDDPGHLPAKLEAVTEVALDKLSAVLATAIDVENGPLLRAQMMAAAVAINAQLRADALRMRAVRADRALDRLLAMIASKEGLVPCGSVAPGRSEELGHADGGPRLVAIDATSTAV